MGAEIVLRAGGTKLEIDSSSSDTHPAISFGTHANYIRAFAMLAGAPTTHEESARALATLYDLVRPTLEGLERATVLSPAARGRVASSLKNAWGGEAWLAAGGTFATEGELLGLANNWGVVQAYYACYHA
ncbi:MAG: hypothetical protein M3P51_09340, partial [Chloroflexota bacterium]|nr:hypothetical protein [Chloroflexota bacterium]